MELENRTTANIERSNKAIRISDPDLLLTVKIERAYGGCLGTRSR